MRWLRKKSVIKGELLATGYLVELAIQGVAKGLLEPITLQFAQHALKHATTPIPAPVLEAAAELNLPDRRFFEKKHHTWDSSQVQWKPLVEQSLTALIANPEQPSIFWEGAALAGRLLQPINWGHREAAELVVFYKLSQGVPLPVVLEQTLRKRLDYSGSISDLASLPVGVELWSFGYGVMMLCRYADHPELYKKAIPLLDRLRWFLEQDPLPVWMEAPLAELSQLLEAGCTESVCLLTPSMAGERIKLNTKQRSVHQALLRGTKTLQRHAAAGRIERMKRLGYALHNHPSMLASPPRNV